MRLIFNNFHFKAFCLSVFIGLSVTGAVMHCATGVKEDLAQSVLRLHVVANSNSPNDQALKIKVRDRVIQYLKPRLAQARTVSRSKQIIDANRSGILAVCRDEIRKNGGEYGVRLATGTFDFPTKQYGDARLPAGRYDALRILIGKAEGENWWCVLYPQLCFVNSTPVLPPEGRSQLKSALTKEEYSIVMSGDESKLPVKIKFRLLEMLK